MGEMVLAVDTSASVSARELEAFAAEFQAIMTEVRPGRIHVVYCDTMVQAARTHTAEDLDVPFVAPGRGGTRFVPVFDWIAAQEIEPACLVYLTDLECNEFPAEPAFPTLWVSTWLKSAPFGEVVDLIL